MTYFRVEERKQSRAGVAIVLGLVVSLAALSILSRNQVTPYLWITAAAFLAPIPIALVFRKEIASLAVWLYIAAVLLVLVTALLFGV